MNGRGRDLLENTVLESASSHEKPQSGYMMRNIFNFSKFHWYLKAWEHHGKHDTSVTENTKGVPLNY
jgi:hypothetical protein